MCHVQLCTILFYSFCSLKYISVGSICSSFLHISVEFVDYLHFHFVSLSIFCFKCIYLYILFYLCIYLAVNYKFSFIKLAYLSLIFLILYISAGKCDKLVHCNFATLNYIHGCSALYVAIWETVFFSHFLVPSTIRAKGFCSFRFT